MSNFRHVFYSLRKQRGLTQAQIADELQISRSAIGMYEQGNREPDFETMEKIADYFNVDMNILHGHTAPEYSSIKQSLIDLISEISDEQAEALYHQLTVFLGKK